ncbi:MAG TPA: hypothetical protein VGA75_01300 [Paracoccaceae bacterium]
MSERCKFYRTEFRVLRANAHRPGAMERAPKRVGVAFCAHAASPAPRGSDKALGCGGDLGKCPIADKLI